MKHFVMEVVLYREIMDELIEWKDSKRRKPLILTGVRQCGKTYTLKEFGERYFDEIQECPKAIASLKYFYEDFEELHLVCAGSLLGVALKKENISFPVGKVNRMIPESYVRPMEQLLKTYYAVGGMPEVVNNYAENAEIPLAINADATYFKVYMPDIGLLSRRLGGLWMITCLQKNMSPK